jgi:cysteinyl-tRNA synthetase
MFGLAKEINIYYSAVMAGKAPYDAETMATVQGVYYEFADILGLLAGEIAGKDAGGSDDGATVGRLLDLIVDIRREARKKKDWGTADTIRDRLGEIGYIIEDSPQGARWKKR